MTVDPITGATELSKKLLEADMKDQDRKERKKEIERNIKDDNRRTLHLNMTFYDPNFLDDFLKKIRDKLQTNESLVNVKKFIENYKDGPDKGYDYIKRISNFAIRMNSKFLAGKIDECFNYFVKISKKQEWLVKRSWFFKKVSTQEKFLNKIQELIEIIQKEDYRIKL